MLNLIPCDYRGEFIKEIDCGCAGGPWHLHACPQTVSRQCVPDATQLSSRAIQVDGPKPECLKCSMRKVNGSLVGPPSRDELRKLNPRPQKEMTDARARKLGINPVKQTVVDHFPVDKYESYPICRSTLHHEDAEFNPAIAIHNGVRYVAYRQNWANANIVVSQANGAWEPERGAESCRFVNLPIVQENSAGREDPRFFQFRGDLWLAYTGFARRGDWRNTVCIGRLGKDGAMDCHFPLHYEHRAKAEKNWAFFEHDNKLYCIYLSAPAHIVLECDQFNCRLAYATQWNCPYSPGEIRGGASPVLVGDEWYHFFHTSIQGNGTRVYTAGVLTFENKPPFRVKRCSKRPLIIPNAAEIEPGSSLAAAVFPGGAVLDSRKNKWEISYGYLDKECRVAQFRFEDIEAELYPVGTP